MGNTLVNDSLPQENLLKSIHENEINAITDAAEWLNATMSQLLHNTDMIASQSDSSFATPNIVTTSTELLVNDKSYMKSYTLPHLIYLTWTKSFLSRSWHVLNL